MIYLLCVINNNNEISLTNYETIWVLHSSAYHHVTSRKEIFSSYILGEFGVVKMGIDGQDSEPFSCKARMIMPIHYNIQRNTHILPHSWRLDILLII